MHFFKALYSIIVFFVCGFIAELKAHNVLSLEIKSSKPEIAQVYFDEGKGLPEANSVKATIKGNGEFEHTEFTINAANFNALHLDQIEKSCSVELRSVNLKSGDKQFPIPLDQVMPANQIAKTEIREGVLLIETLPGDAATSTASNRFGVTPKLDWRGCVAFAPMPSFPTSKKQNGASITGVITFTKSYLKTLSLPL